MIMVLRLLAITILLCGAGGFSGCACPSARCGVPASPAAPCLHPLTVGEQVPPDVLVDCSAEPLPLPAPTEIYHLLDETTCQCHAAANASLANMVELERHWAKIIMECDGKIVRDNLRLDRDLLSLHASDLRNAAAASALTAFHQLAGLEAQQHYLQAGLEESRQTVERIDKILAKGLKIPAEVQRDSIVKQINALEEQQLQLNLLRIQLNGQLQTLLACPLEETNFYWPQVDWQPNLTAVDLETELALGLAHRTDLRGLNLVRRQLRQTTLPIGRGVLQLADATVGSVEPRPGIWHVARCLHCNHAEVPIRCQQLSLFYHQAHQGTIAEIKAAAYKISLLQQRVVAAQRIVLELQEELEKQQKTRDVNYVSVFRLSRTRGRLFEAQADLIEQIVALQVARVQLREAQDMLAVECGFGPHLVCGGCCDKDGGACPTASCNTSRRAKCHCQQAKNCCD